MIHVSLSTIVLLPLITGLLAILVWWIYYGVRDARRQAPVRQERIYRCAVCNHVYVDARNVPLARCTRCGCLNEALRR